MSFTTIPMTWRQACEYVTDHHRHHGPPRGCKWAIGITDGTGMLRGVALCGRPVSRMLDDGYTIEVNRTCTDGYPNANSALYGACWRIARAMGYRQLITYNQEGETGASLRAAGLVPLAELPTNLGWDRPNRRRTPRGTENVARTLWGITAGRARGGRV